MNSPQKKLSLVITLAVALILLATAAFYILPQNQNGHDHDEQDEQWYISGMHPWIIQQGPGLCPICGMELTPLRPDMLGGDIAIDPTLTQNIGLRMAEVKEGRLTLDSATFGTVVYNQSTLRDVVARANGYIEKLLANQLYQPVRQDELLAELHSPAVIAAGHELVTALRSASPTRQAEAARQKLRILGVAPETVEAIEASGEVPWTYPVFSPVDGLVAGLTTTAGQAITTGQVLLELANLDDVWVEGVLSQSQATTVKPGQSVELYFQGSNSKPRLATIDILYPAVDPVTRQTRFRVVVENTDHTLRPGQYARITIKTDESRAPVGLIIPREALLDSGDTQRVFVSEGGGRFAPRKVTVLAENHRGEVLIGEGLVAGEQIVVSGQFLLDSESRLREALLKMIAPEEPEEPEPTEAGSMDSERARLWRNFYQAYLPLVKAMAADDSAHLGHQVEALTSATQRLADKEPGAKPLAEMITRLSNAKKLDELRPHFRTFNDRLKPLALERGVPAAVEETLVFLRCPMYPEMGDNAWWVQIDGPAANPYYGASMLRCFDEKMILPRAAKEEAHRHD